MPRIPNTRPTSIYWLIDVRSETLVQYPNGRPFYCGKTVESLRDRLQGHRNGARRWPHRSTSRMVAACADSIEIRLLETVPAGCDWHTKEKRWIAILRDHFPGATNVSDGGDGCPGMVCSDETKRKIGAGNRGKVRTPEVIEKFRLAKTGKKQTPEHIANMRAAVTGKPKSEAHKAAMSRARKGKRVTPEALKSMREARVLRRGRAAIAAYHDLPVEDRPPLRYA